MATVKPTDRIFLKGNYHKNVFYKGKKHKEAWMEVDGELQCVWRKMLKLGNFISTSDVLDIEEKQVSFLFPDMEEEFELLIGSAKGGFYIFESLWSGDYYITGKSLEYPTQIDLPSSFTGATYKAENGSGIVGISLTGFTIIDVSVSFNEKSKSWNAAISEKTTVSFPQRMSTNSLAMFVGTKWENGQEIKQIGIYLPASTSGYYNIWTYSAKTGEQLKWAYTKDSNIAMLMRYDSHLFSDNTIVSNNSSYIYIGDSGLGSAKRIDNSLKKVFYCMGKNNGLYYVLVNENSGTIYSTSDFSSFTKVYEASELSIPNPDGSENYTVKKWMYLVFWAFILT